MIKIIQYEGNWRINIEDETWEFKTRKEMDLILKKVLDSKEKYGEIFPNQR